MDFSRSEIHKLVERVDFLQRTTYDLDEGRASPRTDMECIDPGAPLEYQWEGLGKQQRVEVLNRSIDWMDFDPKQADRIIDNIASGKERIHWFDDVPMGWRGTTEREHQQWLEFEKLPPEEQLREAARAMKQSQTLGGDNVSVYTKWEEMNDRQRKEVIFNQLRMPDMPYSQWKKILKEELGHWPGEGPVKTEEKPLPSPGKSVVGPPPAAQNRQPWPSEFVSRNQHQPGNDHGNENGHDAGHSM
jgi:hypothetical protein